MSQQKRKGEIRSKAAIEALEASIKQVTEEFQGDSAFNFYHEMELASYLLLSIRQKYTYTVNYNNHPVHLSRLEWPCIYRKRIDLILWKPGSEIKARKMWRYQRGRVAKQIPLIAAIQIKRGGGEVTSWNATRYDLARLKEIHLNKDLGKPILYFVEWVDTNIREKKSAQERYQFVKLKLIEWCNESPELRRVLVISRDRVGFVYPTEAWSINPLPDATLNEI